MRLSLLVFALFMAFLAPVYSAECVVLNGEQYCKNSSLVVQPAMPYQPPVVTSAPPACAQPAKWVWVHPQWVCALQSTEYYPQVPEYYPAQTYPQQTYYQQSSYPSYYSSSGYYGYGGVNPWVPFLFGWGLGSVYSNGRGGSVYYGGRGGHFGRR